MTPEPGPPPEFDLHGATAAQARERLIEALARAHAERVPTLIVIHGRGWRSGGKAVLPRTVRSFLQDLLEHPRAGIKRVRFGEHVLPEPNPGTVWIDLFLERAQPVFDPQAPRGKRSRKPPRPAVPRAEEFDVPAEFERDFDRYFQDEDLQPPS